MKPQTGPLDSPIASEEPGNRAGIYAHPKTLAAIDAWKRSLLDLTKRNRALNFAPNKVSTVTVVGEDPAAVFRRLSVQELAVRFKPSGDSSDTTPRTALSESSPADEMPHTSEQQSNFESDDDGLFDDVPSGTDYAPASATPSEAEHDDGWLQTTQPTESLNKSLRRIEERARLTIEEQGVNTLFLALGMLHFTESADSQRVLKAPLILVPVELKRKSAQAAYAARATDDDPLVNVALGEYLRQSFGIELPQLPDSDAIAEEYDLNEWLTAATNTLRSRQGWRVTTDIYLGHFSFQKFVMYKDLEANAVSLGSHRLIRLITGAATGERMTGMPVEIREMDLDRDYPPEATHQVVDADSSQLRAIAAAARHHDVVLEGPPGTGKSQTITNLVAQALGVGKSVLFVAEKMAALQVVYSRLVEAGLGEFCLELHSTKANKRAVISELARSLDASLAEIAVPTGATERLPKVRAVLTEYVRALHEPFGTLGISPFAAYGALGQVYDAKRVKYDGPVDSLTRPDIDETVRGLGDLAAAATTIGDPSLHPWRDSTRSLFSDDDRDSIQEAVDRCLASIEHLIRSSEQVERTVGLPAVRVLSDVDVIRLIGSLLRRAPGAAATVLASDAWNTAPDEAMTIIAAGRHIQTLRERVNKRFKSSVFSTRHADDVAYVQRKSKGLARLTVLFDGRYRAIKKRWIDYRLPSLRCSLREQAAELMHIDELADALRSLKAEDAKARAMFGSHWRGAESDWGGLEQYVSWVVEFRAICSKHHLSDAALEFATNSRPDLTPVDLLDAAAKTTDSALRDVERTVGWSGDYLSSFPVRELQDRLSSLVRRIDEGPRWAAFESTRREVAAGPAASLLPAALSGEATFADLPATFQRAFYSKWLSNVVQSRERLAQFQTMTHEQRAAEFRALDERVLRENRAALVSASRDHVQHQIRQGDAQPGMAFLQRQMAKQRGLSSLRRTMREAGPAIRAIKPCLMMSPLSVAQYLNDASPSFDLVIFDEASQLPAEDAVGAVVRGKQLVVVGDPKQLPPTNFFSVLHDESAPAVADDGTVLYEDSESILEEFMGAGLPMTRLKWHYRSAHESLIHFSNVSFYDADLYTFPSVERNTDALGLQFEFVPEGVYEGKGLNIAEARRVADAVVKFAKEQSARRARSEPVWSLGVGTFNLRQQLAIQDELEVRRRSDPSIDAFFDHHDEPFFVKNLENIQGDERDVIFLSVTYAKGPDAKLRQNFGPLNGENGWRRLNVLVTRARRRMRVFSSMKGDEISASSTSSYGARLLREFLLYAERGRLESAAASVAADTESPFESGVATELTRCGLMIVPQVGVAGYRIDIGVLDSKRPGRFLCGIECDGVAYHSSDTARDRDRLRQQVLERRGWKICRLWSTDWFKDRKGQIERLIAESQRG